MKNNEGLVTTDSRGYLQGKGSEINSDSIYQIHNTPDDYSGLQGVYGFVRVAADEDNAPVYENADEIQSWECFEFFKHNEYVYIKSQANDKYITCVLDEEGNRLCARGDAQIFYRPGEPGTGADRGGGCASYRACFADEGRGTADRLRRGWPGLSVRDRADQPGTGGTAGRGGCAIGWGAGCLDHPLPGAAQGGQDGNDRPEGG